MILGRQALIRSNVPRPDGTLRIRTDRPTRVAGEKPGPEEPCLVVILMHSTAEEDHGLDRLLTAAKERGDKCIVIRPGDSEKAVINALHEYVPPNATVALLNIDASEAEVEIIRSALHDTPDIITWPKDGATAPGGSHTWIGGTGSQADPCSRHPSRLEEAVTATLIELGRKRLRPDMIVSGEAPLNLNNKSEECRLLSCYQISCQFIMDGLAGPLNMKKYASLSALQKNVRLKTHRQVLLFASQSQESSMESNESFGMLQQRQAEGLGPDAPVCAFLVRSPTHAMAVLLQHSKDVKGRCRVQFLDPYRTNCVVKLEASTAELASASLRIYLEHLDRQTNVGHKFDVLFEGQDRFLVDVFRPGDLDRNRPPGPRPLQSMQKGPINASVLVLLLENNHADALAALKPQLLAMDGKELIKVLTARAGTYKTPLSAALESGAAEGFRILAEVMGQKLEPAERLEVLLSNTRALCDAYMNGRSAIIDSFLDATEGLSQEQRASIHEAMCKSSMIQSAYANPRTISGWRSHLGERHFEPFDFNAMDEVEERTKKLLRGLSDLS